MLLMNYIYYEHYFIFHALVTYFISNDLSSISATNYLHFMKYSIHFIQDTNDPVKDNKEETKMVYKQMDNSHVSELLIIWKLFAVEQM